MFIRTEDGEVVPVDDLFLAHCSTLDKMRRFSACDEEAILPLSAVQSPILLLLLQFASELHERRGCICYVAGADASGPQFGSVLFSASQDPNAGPPAASLPKRSKPLIEAWIAREARAPNGLAAQCHKWISDFFYILDQQTLIDFINLANLLDFPEAIELGCKQVALMIRGKHPDEIRALFNIETDFTDAEMAEMRRQYQWASAMLNKPL
ncbi:hypothetical protein MDAP_000212 [Mitosporidium daphniae]|uniref:E3 ubiquitin ligase complex SCF subunit n=1 Tax=Mitosporidium daphniae TaxID=1485682 RepID=A0A098VVL5_9MICR|nr:uncharacterized protein DI09_106p20 [Mitosporidium daphniae]KGG53178.1 hypothetical protein DI09_106p20 [Mitosporidium daphniae]|eukprot:XP_013239614.1 uncharacterized protein DI09_106p20 [Mitosporidium daphniae]